MSLLRLVTGAQADTEQDDAAQADAEQGDAAQADTSRDEEEPSLKRSKLSDSTNHESDSAVPKDRFQINGVQYCLPPDDVPNEVALRVQTQGLNVSIIDLLTYWGLQSLSSNLNEHQIFDVPTLLEITPNDIEQTTQIVGFRVRLRHLILHMKTVHGLPSTSGLPNLSLESSITERPNAVHQKIPDLKGLLKQSTKGKQLIKEYEINKTLINGSRNNLVEIIFLAAYELGIDLNNSLYDVMSGKIESLFPTETKSIYFYPPKYGVNACRAGGKFIWRKSKVAKLHGLQLKPADADERVAADEEPAQVQPSANQSESKKWLHRGRSPEELVVKHWINCRDIRRKIITSASTMQIVTNEFPIITTALGGNLLLRDFEDRWPGKLKYYYDNIFNLRDTLPMSFKQFRCEEHQALAQRYILLKEASEVNENLKNLLMVRLLPVIVPTNNTITKKWRPSLVEAQDGVILIAQETMDFHCYECELVCSTLDGLISHYISDHNRHKNSVYHCILENCTRTYSYSSTYKKHIKRDHPNIGRLPATVETTGSIPTDLPVNRPEW